MKYSLFIISLVIVLLECKKNDEPEYYFSLRINGKQTSYHTHLAIENYLRKGFTLIIAGDSTDVFQKANEQFQIFVKIDNKKEFDLNDSLIAAYAIRDSFAFFSSPRAYANFSLTDQNQERVIFDRISTNFHLVINYYDSFNKIISGHFNGILRNPDKTDSMVITDGQFKVTLEKDIENNLLRDIVTHF